MTIRAILIGVSAALFLCAFNYVNDNILRQTYLIGHALPFAVYGALIATVALLNPLLRRVRVSWTLRRRDLAVALTVVLAVCCIPSSGLLRTFELLNVLGSSQKMRLAMQVHQSAGHQNRPCITILATDPRLQIFDQSVPHEPFHHHTAMWKIRPQGQIDR